MVPTFVHDPPSPRVVFGAGSLTRVPDETRALGRRVMLVAGAHARDSADQVSAAFGADVVARIHQVVEHVPADVAAQAVQQARVGEVDVVVSIGGGSATGLAKAVAKETGVPVVAVPTTYAGSEMTPIWGLTEAAAKTTGRLAAVVPRTVVYDPELTVRLPVEVSTASGMNAMAHCVEALYAPDATPVTSLLAEEGLRRLALALPAIVADPGDLGGRSDAMHGAWLSGWVLGSTTMGLHHKLAHVLGGGYGLSHRGVHAALLPQVAAFNAEAAPDALGRAARALGGTRPVDAGRVLFELAGTIGAPTSLAALGLSIDAVEQVAAAVSASGVDNPAPTDDDALRTLLLNAYAGRGPQEYR